MGTHPSNPSKDITTGRTLLDLVAENTALLSHDIAAHYGSKLPFLLKVLSIQKALSIQAHPDKKLAEKLHKEDPKNYPGVLPFSLQAIVYLEGEGANGGGVLIDDNHKPEMAIAVTAFDGFCGFRPLAEIVSFLKSTPQLRILLGEASDVFISAVSSSASAIDESTVSSNKQALKDLFEALMTQPTDRVQSLAEKLVESAKSSPAQFAGQEHGGKKFADLITRLDEQFPGDIGLFCAFFLNYVELQPGEAMFLQADDPHAYLSGGLSHPLIPKLQPQAQER